MGFLKDDIGDEELNNKICSILASNMCTNEVSENSEEKEADNTSNEIKFIPYTIIDNKN